MQFRRIVAVAILASLAGSQPVAASCAMTSAATVNATPAATDGSHEGHEGHGGHAVAADHSAHTPSSDQAHASTDAAPDHGGSQGGTCDLMMACAAAAPAVRTAVGPDASPCTLLSETTPAAARAAPSLAFETPPPRSALI